MWLLSSLRRCLCAKWRLHLFSGCYVCVVCTSIFCDCISFSFFRPLLLPLFIYLFIFSLSLSTLSASLCLTTVLRIPFSCFCFHVFPIQSVSFLFFLFFLSSPHYRTFVCSKLGNLADVLNVSRPSKYVRSPMIMLHNLCFNVCGSTWDSFSSFMIISNVFQIYRFHDFILRCVVQNFKYICVCVCTCKCVFYGLYSICQNINYVIR